MCFWIFLFLPKVGFWGWVVVHFSVLFLVIFLSGVCSWVFLKMGYSKLYFLVDFKEVQRFACLFGVMVLYLWSLALLKGFSWIFGIFGLLD